MFFVSVSVLVYVGNLCNLTSEFSRCKVFLLKKVRVRVVLSSSSHVQEHALSEQLFEAFLKAFLPNV